jgi:hypothetical protein
MRKVANPRNRAEAHSLSKQLANILRGSNLLDWSGRVSCGKRVVLDHLAIGWGCQIAVNFAGTYL